MQKNSAIYLAAGAAFIALLPLAVVASEPLLHRGDLISEVRARLIKDGWTPVRVDKIVPEQDRINPDVKEYKNLSGGAQDLFKAGFYEVEKCVGADFNECTFNYQKNGECLRLKTQGEYAPGLGEPTLFSWTNDCPG